MTINLNFISSFFSWVTQIINFLDNISVGGLFSLLDFALAILLISVFLPMVLSLRNSSSGRGSSK